MLMSIARSPFVYFERSRETTGICRARNRKDDLRVARTRANSRYRAIWGRYSYVSCLVKEVGTRDLTPLSFGVKCGLNPNKGAFATTEGALRSTLLLKINRCSNCFGLITVSWFDDFAITGAALSATETAVFITRGPFLYERKLVPHLQENTAFLLEPRVYRPRPKRVRFDFRLMLPMVLSSPYSYKVEEAVNHGCH